MGLLRPLMSVTYICTKPVYPFFPFLMVVGYKNTINLICPPSSGALDNRYPSENPIQIHSRLLLSFLHTYARNAY